MRTGNKNRWILQLVVTNWQSPHVTTRLPKSILLKHMSICTLPETNMTVKPSLRKKLIFQTIHLQELLLMEEILHQLIIWRYPIIYKVLYMPGGAGFLPSTVCWFRGGYCISYGGLSPFPVFSLAVEGIASIACKTTDDFHQRCFCSKVVTNPDSFAGFCRDVYRLEYHDTISLYAIVVCCIIYYYLILYATIWYDMI